VIHRELHVDDSSDVAVVGAGPGGSTAAAFLARAGLIRCCSTRPASLATRPAAMPCARRACVFCTSWGWSRP